jgi:SAM-dependent methyltransferase
LTEPPLGGKEIELGGNVDASCPILGEEETLHARADAREGRRVRAREIARRYLNGGDSTGWFEELYSRADGDPATIPWADLVANPNLVEWLDRRGASVDHAKALTIGCGLGDDAEELVARGFDTTAFDISGTAIEWCASRFPRTRVHYLVADLFHTPPSWVRAFALVVESNTLQVFPNDERKRAIERIADLVAPGGTLLVIARGREEQEDPGEIPWPLTARELREFTNQGLVETSFEDYMDREDPPVRRFRVTYVRP